MPNAYAFRLKPSGHDRVQELLAQNEIAIGWSKASELLNPALTIHDFRDLISRHYPDIVTRNRASHDANHLWRFIRELMIGDLVVVPHGEDIYFLKVSGNAAYVQDAVEDDTAIRRSVVPCYLHQLSGALFR